MHPDVDALLEEHDLTSFKELIDQAVEPAIRFSLKNVFEDLPTGMSRVGGCPDLPPDFSWPENQGRRLDYLLQVNLEDLAKFEHPEMPTRGMLTFFYDMYNGPWGYDPKDLSGYRVVHHPNLEVLERLEEVHEEEYLFTESLLQLRYSETLPHGGSRAYRNLMLQMQPEDMQEAMYRGLAREYEKLFTGTATAHQFFGHSCNIQGDMQLEAQLVMNGLYCGDATGYRDPRAAALAENADQWQLLLQLDSDDDIWMWGDCGLLYYWIRRDDLAVGNFDKVWMTLQCY